MEEGQVTEGDHVLVGLGALGEDGHDGHELDAADLVEQRLQRAEAAARRDDVVHERDLLAAQAFGVDAVEVVRLEAFGGGALHVANRDDVPHVGADLLARDDGRESREAAHRVEERRGFAVRHDQRLDPGRDELHELGRGGLGHLPVAEHVEEGDVDGQVGHRSHEQVADDATDLDVMRSRFLHDLLLLVFHDTDRATHVVRQLACDAQDLEGPLAVDRVGGLRTRVRDPDPVEGLGGLEALDGARLEVCVRGEGAHLGGSRRAHAFGAGDVGLPGSDHVIDDDRDLAVYVTLLQDHGHRSVRLALLGADSRRVGLAALGSVEVGRVALVRAVVGEHVDDLIFQAVLFHMLLQHRQAGPENRPERGAEEPLHGERVQIVDHDPIRPGARDGTDELGERLGVRNLAFTARALAGRRRIVRQQDLEPARVELHELAEHGHLREVGRLVGEPEQQGHARSADLLDDVGVADEQVGLSVRVALPADLDQLDVVRTSCLNPSGELHHARSGHQNAHLHERFPSVGCERACIRAEPPSNCAE